MIYYAKADSLDLIKIGYSKNPENILKKLIKDDKKWQKKE